MSKYKKHREFLHDISNKMAVIEGGIIRACKLLPKELDSKDLVENLAMSSNYAKECILKLKEYRTFIHLLEQESKDNE